MAYCEKCGAYVPDGQTKCLACGYDPSASQPSASAYQQQSEQEEAERREEARRREERRQRQEEYRRQAEAEFARRQKRQQEQERRAEERSSGHPYSDEGRVYSSYNSAPRPRQAGQNKLLAAASYLGILCILPYIFCPEDHFAHFHAKQGLVLLLFEVLTSVIGGLTGIGWLLSLFSLYCVFKGISGVLGGRMEELPLIGQLANRIR